MSGKSSFQGSYIYINWQRFHIKSMYRSWNTWKVMHFTFQASIACVDSDRSRPSDLGGGGGGGAGAPPPQGTGGGGGGPIQTCGGGGGGRSPRPGDRGGGGGLKKKLFRPFGPQFGPKVTGGAGLPRAPPFGSATGWSRPSHSLEHWYCGLECLRRRRGRESHGIYLSVVESHGKLKFCLVELLLQMTKQGQCKIERIN